MDLFLFFIFFFSFFINAAVENDFKAAGILIYTTFQDNNYFLLGRDKCNEQWSDFGGDKENQESAMQTACRECSEESGFLISLDEKTVSVFNQQTMYKMFLAFLDYDKITKHFESYKFTNKECEEKDQFILMPTILLKQCEKVTVNQCQNYYVVSGGTNYKIRPSFYRSIDIFCNSILPVENLFSFQGTSPNVIQLYHVGDHTRRSWQFYGKFLVISFVLMYFVKIVIFD